MPARSPIEADGQLVLVHLSDVPLKKRHSTAERLIRVQGLHGSEALMLLVAAENPRQNPSLLVPAELAAKVCR